MIFKINMLRMFLCAQIANAVCLPSIGSISSTIEPASDVVTVPTMNEVNLSLFGQAISSNTIVLANKVIIEQVLNTEQGMHDLSETLRNQYRVNVVEPFESLYEVNDVERLSLVVTLEDQGQRDYLITLGQIFIPGDLYGPLPGFNYASHGVRIFTSPLSATATPFVPLTSTWHQEDISSMNYYPDKVIIGGVWNSARGVGQLKDTLKEEYGVKVKSIEFLNAEDEFNNKKASIKGRKKRNEFVVTVADRDEYEYLIHCNEILIYGDKYRRNFRFRNPKKFRPIYRPNDETEYLPHRVQRQYILE